jgi:L-serine dehydratase
MRRFYSIAASKASITARNPYYSVFDLFKIGVGPSSSHTNAPMIAGKIFAQNLNSTGLAGRVSRLKVDLLGSLALTGSGHGTMRAVALGLAGNHPETVPISDDFLKEQSGTVQISLGDSKSVSFSLSHDIQLIRKFLPGKHPNFMRIYALDETGDLLSSQEFSSIGGGELAIEPFESKSAATKLPVLRTNEERNLNARLPFPFTTGNELLKLCLENQLTIPQLMLQNECALWNSDLNGISSRIITIIKSMFDSIQRGCLSTQSILPGGLYHARRAPEMFKNIQNCDEIEKLSIYALAVSEENAAGGRVVTSPTNGSAGVIPAVLFHHCASDGPGALDFMLTAAAIGAIFKNGASVSAAQVGCQGEIGVSSSMAAAGLTILRDASKNPKKVLNAAEIAMEHHLGMTCDPVMGLVQVPCIERNAMGAIKAITACKLALLGNGHHTVSLDACVQTMFQTGLHMDAKFKETSLGGLADHFQPQKEEEYVESKSSTASC